MRKKSNSKYAVGEKPAAFCYGNKKTKETMMEFWKATGIRALRTFLQVIAGAWTAGKLITELEWKTILTAALSAAVFSVITSLIAGLPEVDNSIATDDVDDVDALDFEPGDEEAGDDDE